MKQIENPRIGIPPSPPRARIVAPVSILVASLLPALVPMVASAPLLPPTGLMMLLGWRLYRSDILRVWAATPLGFFDDLVSGQPLGSAILLWSLCMLAIDVLDTRLVQRDFWQDWLIAGGAIGFCLLAGRLLASPLAAHVDGAVAVQIVVATALFPLAMRLCGLLDRRSAEA